MHSHFPKPCITALLRTNDFSLYPIFRILKTCVWIYCTKLFFVVLIEMYVIHTTSESIDRQKKSDFFENLRVCSRQLLVRVINDFLIRSVSRFSAKIC